jgi:homoserine O-acetyltransferase
VLSVGIRSDVLYPPYQQRELADLVNEGHGDAHYTEIDSGEGHDAFLIETGQVGDALTAFLDKISA